MSEIRIPKEFVNDEVVTIVSLPVRPDQAIDVGEIVAEIETSKSNITIHSESKGFVAYQCSVGDILPINGLIAGIESQPPAISTETSGKNDIGKKSVINSTRIESLEPVFSTKALSKLKEFQIDANHFKGVDFVRTADVQSINEIDRAHQQSKSINHEIHDEICSENNDCISAPNTGPLSGNSFSDLIYLINSDLYRYEGNHKFLSFCKHFAGTPGFQVSTLARICDLARKNSFHRFTTYPLLTLFFRWSSRRYGIRIPLALQVGSGLYIGHWGGIWINPNTIIGSNCNLSQEVSIGSAGKDSAFGHPVIGDRVYIGPGAKIAGPIRIGSDVVVAANSLLTKNTPDNCLVIGVPAQITAKIREDNGYISNASPTRKLSSSKKD